LKFIAGKVEKIFLHSSCMFQRFFLSATLLSLFACDDDEPKAIVHVDPIPGQIVVYNSCGIFGVAAETRDVLRANGFDVLSAQTDPQWSNYEETIVAIRNPHWAGYNKLKAILDTKNFIVLQDTLSGNVSATVFLGKDYKKVLKIKRGNL